MEGSGSRGFDGSLLRKPRSSSSRRPRPEAPSSHPTISSLDDGGASHNGFRLREFYLNHPPPGGSTNDEGTKASKKRNKSDVAVHELDRHSGSSRGSGGGGGSSTKRSTEGVLAPANWKSSSKNGDRVGMLPSTEGRDASDKNKQMKMKLKVAGVTHTFEAKHRSDGSPLSTLKPPRPADVSRSRPRHSTQNSDQRISGGRNSSPSTKKESRGVTSGKALALEPDDMLPSVSPNEPVRKSSRVPKRRINTDFDEVHQARSFEKYRSLRADADDGVGPPADVGEHIAKKRKASNSARGKGASYDADEDFAALKPSRDSRRRLRESSDDFVEDELVSEKESEVKNSKRKEAAELETSAKTEPLRTRRRARESGNDGTGDSLIEFPDGLPLPSSRKQRGKLSEVELQAKKAEAAQRRRMQVEKAAKESEAEAIRKILGLDSDKKKEEKKQKEREEKEKIVQSQRYNGSTIRWVMGPKGTVVSFPDDMGLPSMFNSPPLSYPPPREKCAGPACQNAYKYRDSKSNLPLCSLECYKAVQGNA